MIAPIYWSYQSIMIRNQVMDVMSVGEGCLRAVPCTGVALLLWILGGLFVLYEMILLNSQDIDTRDMLNDFRSTIEPIQNHHESFSKGFWPRLASNVSQLFGYSEIILPSKSIPVVNLVTTNLTCPILDPSNMPCLSATLSADSLLRGYSSEYSSCHDFAARHPNSTQLMSSTATAPASTTSALMNMASAPSGITPSTWNATTWELVACNNWNTMLTLNCTNIIRDPCAEAWDLMSYIANNNNNNNNNLNNVASINVRFVQTQTSTSNNSTAVEMSVTSYWNAAAQFPVMSLPSGTTIQDSIDRAKTITDFATSASQLQTTSLPRVGLKEAIFINNDRLTLLSMPPTAYQRHKGFGWKPPFWVHPDPCPYVNDDFSYCLCKYHTHTHRERERGREKW